MCGHPEGCQWPNALARALSSRRRDLGDHKGRVLYGFQVRWGFQERIAVGALAYHLENGVIRILHVGTTREKQGIAAAQVVTLLILCAETIARKHGCDRIEWTVSDDDAADSASRTFGFRRVRKSDRRQKKLRGRILLERRLV